MKYLKVNMIFKFYLSYQEHREIGAAQGVKIAAKELEKTVAGLNLLVANHQDEIEICKEEMEKRLQSALQSFKVKDRGVFVQASTLGSLEALLAFLKDSKIPVSLYFLQCIFSMYWNTSKIYHNFRSF